MSADELELASAFPARSLEDWRPIAEASLKGKPLSKLTRETLDGVQIAPLYGPEAAAASEGTGLPGQAPYVRGARAAPEDAQGWSIAAQHGRGDLEQLQADLLHDLERGVNEVHLGFDAAARRGLEVADAEDALALGGAPIHDLADLELALTEVREDLAPVTPDAGAGFAGAAALLVALWRRRDRDLSTLRGGFGADPIGAWATQGSLLESPAGALGTLAELATWNHRNAPGVRAARIRTSGYGLAGASEAQELGTMLAVGIAYLRAFAEAGLEPEAAAAQIELEVTVGTRFLSDVAKLRAARRVWARVVQAFGAEDPQIRLHAVASARVLTQRDPWVNMLRGTAACFAGAIGGAASVRIDGFDAALGGKSELGRRVARNTQVILQEESHLGAVVDPAGGAWFIEQHTEALARAAWAQMQVIEGEGGAIASLQNGALAARFAASWAARAARIAKRKQPITGVSEFPNISERPVEGEPEDRSAAIDAVRARHAEAGPRFEAPEEGNRFEAAIDAALRGASLASVAAGLRRDHAPVSIPALPRHRDAESFEALRAASDGHRATSGAAPKVLLVNLGPVAGHTARATWAKNFFEAAGIEAISNDGFETPEAAVEALTRGGASAAVLCGPDGLYEAEVSRFTPALLGAGAKLVFLAGNPGERRAAYEAAGIGGFVHIGCDVLGILQSTIAKLGVTS